MERALAVCLLLAAACSSKPAEPPPQPTASVDAEPEPDPPPGPPEAEPAETGQTCATATALCDAGTCTVKLKNDCEKPLTCDGFVVLRCRTPTEAVEGRGRGRQTFAAKTEGELAISGNCTMGNLENTQLSELQCK